MATAHGKECGYCFRKRGAAGQGTAGHSPHFPQPTLHLKRPCVVSGSEALAARPIAERLGGTGRVGSRCAWASCRDPRVGCGSEAQHASTRGAHPTPRKGQKTSSTEHTLPHIPLDLDGHACMPGGSRNLGDRPDRCPGPLTPYIGDSRCRQKVPAKLVCGRYFFSLSTITRGYHHGLSRRLPAHASRPKNVSRSVISFAHTTLQKPPAKNQSRARERHQVLFAPNIRTK